MKKNIFLLVVFVISLFTYNSSNAQTLPPSTTEDLQKEIEQFWKEYDKLRLKEKKYPNWLKGFSPNFNNFQTQGPFVPDFKASKNMGIQCAIQHWPNVTALKDNSYIVVWSDARNGDFDIYGQRYTSEGVAVGSNFRINDDSGCGSQTRCDVGADSSGNFIVVWQDSRQIRGIFLQRFTSDCSPIGTNVRVDDLIEMSTNPAKPAIAVQKDGSCMVVWTRISPDFSVYSQIFDKDGVKVNSNFQISEFDKEGWPCRVGAVTMKKNGDYIVAWVNRTLDKVYKQRYNQDGIALGNNVRVDDDISGEYKYRPAAACDDNGNCFIMWEDGRNQTSTNIYGQRYSEEGIAIGANFQVATGRYPSIDFENNGNLIVAFSNVTVQKLTPNGIKIGNPYQIDEDSGTYTALAKNNVGEFLFVWECVTSGNNNMLARRMTSDANGIENTILVNDDIKSADQIGPAIATDKNGNFIIAWEDRSTGYSNCHLFGQQFSNQGTIIGEPFQITEREAKMQGTPAGLSQNGDGKFVITWRENDKIVARRFSKNGAALGESIIINSVVGTVEPSYPTIGINNDGKFVIAWNAVKSFGDYQGNLFIKQFDENGKAIGEGFRVNDIEGSVEYYMAPSISMNAMGEFAVSWIKIEEDYCRSIYIQRYSKYGLPLGTNQNIYNSVFDNPPEQPRIVLGNNGKSIVIWYVNNDYNNWDIFAQRYDNLGNPEGEMFKVNDIPIAASPETAPALDMDGTGRFFIGWTNYLNNDFDIYGQRYQFDGTKMGDVFQLSEISDRTQKSPAVSLSNYKICTAWIDNHQMGTGYNVWANVHQWDNEQEQIFSSTTLYHNYPNPFNSTTIIRYYLKESGHVNLTIFNLEGRMVETLTNEIMPEGTNEIEWTVSNLPSGIYFYRLKTSNFNSTKKLVLQK